MIFCVSERGRIQFLEGVLLRLNKLIYYGFNRPCLQFEQFNIISGHDCLHAILEVIEELTVVIKHGSLNLI